MSKFAGYPTLKETLKLLKSTKRIKCDKELLNGKELKLDIAGSLDTFIVQTSSGKGLGISCRDTFSGDFE